MATLLKHRARKPLAVDRLTAGYGMRGDVNDGAYGVSFTLHNYDAGDAAYSVHITNAELDRLIMARQAFGDTPPVEFDDNALSLAKDELAKDEREGLIGLEQHAKALEMAYNMLREFMPPSEQNRNATFAYVASLARY